jgi:two-component system, chemotaxis family, chemotaxis protein CheY
MTGKVLIVDDAPFMRLLIRDAVQSAGYSVVGEAENGEEAIRKYLELRPDVVTMDLVMPLVSGIEGLKAIIKHDPKAKVIVISALDQKTELKEAITAGAFDFIVKPFEAERVTSAIRRATASSGG